MADDNKQSGCKPAIENELHWILDVAMNEDHNRVHKNQGPENMAVLRHMALNLLKQEKSAKGGSHAKQLQAARIMTTSARSYL